MKKLLEILLPWGPVFFGILLFAPHACGSIGQNRVSGVSGIPSLYLAVPLGLIWGFVAKKPGGDGYEYQRRASHSTKSTSAASMAYGDMGTWRLSALGCTMAAGLYRVIPLWLGSIVATVILSACYLPTHEAQHGNISRPNTPLRWFNELVGHVSVFPPDISPIACIAQST